MTSLQQKCIHRIAEAKSIPEDTIALDTTLESLEVDSLDRVSLSFDLEEEYGVEIPETKLHAIQTVGDVATAVQEAIMTKQASTANAA
jgi:acyl carrier protein